MKNKNPLLLSCGILLLLTIIAAVASSMMENTAYGHEHNFSFFLVTAGGTEIPLDVPLEWTGGEFGKWSDTKRFQDNANALDTLLASFALTARIVGITPDDTHIIFEIDNGDGTTTQKSEILRPYMKLPPNTIKIAMHSIETVEDIPEAENAKWTLIEDQLIAKTHVLQLPRLTTIQQQDHGGIYIFNPIDGFSLMMEKSYANGLTYPARVKPTNSLQDDLQAPIDMKGFTLGTCDAGSTTSNTGPTTTAEWSIYQKRHLPGYQTVYDMGLCLKFTPIAGYTASDGHGGSIILSTGAAKARFIIGGEDLTSRLDTCVYNNIQNQCHEIKGSDYDGGSSMGLVSTTMYPQPIHDKALESRWTYKGALGTTNSGNIYDFYQSDYKARDIQIRSADEVIVYVVDDVTPFFDVRMYNDDPTLLDGGRSAADNRNYVIYSDGMEKKRGIGNQISLDRVGWFDTNIIVVMDRLSSESPLYSDNLLDSVDPNITPATTDDLTRTQIYSDEDQVKNRGSFIDVTKNDVIIDRVNKNINAQGDWFDATEPVIYDVRSFVRIPIGADIKASADLYKNETSSDGKSFTETYAKYLGWSDYKKGDYLHVPVVAGFDGIYLQVQSREGAAGSGNILLFYENLVGSSNVHLATSLTVEKGSRVNYPISEGEIEASVSAGTIATHAGTMKAVFTIVSDGSLKLKNSFFTFADNCGILERPRPRDPMSVSIDVYKNGLLVKDGVNVGVHKQPEIFIDSSPKISEGDTSFPLSREGALTTTVYNGVSYKTAWYSTLFNYTDTTFFGATSINVEPGDYVDFVVKVKIYGEFLDEKIRDPFNDCPSSTVVRIGDVDGVIEIKSAIIETSS